MNKPLHPFPARMAPEIVLDECGKLPQGSMVLDPMCGSGTTLRMAQESGHAATGSDLDPLAILISKVNTTLYDSEQAISDAESVIMKAQKIPQSAVKLPWIDTDDETKKFIDFWFANKQKSALRRLVYVINTDYKGSRQDFLKTAISRLIFTKEMAASLARDTSHSRPHRVASSSDYEVYSNFLSACKLMTKRTPTQKTTSARVTLADARRLPYKNEYFDAVITSPPYLNAIDYMRGSKLSLVWLGYRLRDLRDIRSISIGAERKLADSFHNEEVEEILKKMDFYPAMDSKHQGIFKRYVFDMLCLMNEVNRVLKPNGKAILVVGNSCLKGVFVENTKAVIEAAARTRLSFSYSRERELPKTSRYLPVSLNSDNSLNKRMRTEAVLSFVKT